jgi:hypothetical protein
MIKIMGPSILLKLRSAQVDLKNSEDTLNKFFYKKSN